MRSSRNQSRRRIAAARGQLACQLVLLALLIVVAARDGAALQPGLPPPQTVTPDELTDQHIRWAIDALKEGLYALQNNSGTWEYMSPNPDESHLNVHITGRSTLATLALLSAGESHQVPRLQPTIDFLATQKPNYTYTRSLRAHIWAQLPARYSAALARDAQWLLNTYDYNSGSWNYTDIPMTSGYDNSLTQYGVLGLWEAAKRDFEVPPKLWNRVEQQYLRTQLQNGAWNYRPQFSGARGSMTAAGLTCLYITQDYLHAREFITPGVRDTVQQQAIQRGLNWLDENFTANFHPGMSDPLPDRYFFYYLYGIERVGLASGWRRFGEHDWFREGAAAIINRLCDPVYDDAGRGSLVGFRMRPRFATTGGVEPPVVQMSFGLMFLSRGRVPVAINKLQDASIAWNNRPRDAANFTRWLSDEIEQPLNWQILDVHRPLEEWFSAPWVYLTGHEALPWVEAHRSALDERAYRLKNEQRPLDDETIVERLKRYLESGGLLLTNADAKSRAFTDSVRLLGREMFPDYEWRTLPDDHWAYTLSFPVEDREELLGLSNGVRELMIHDPRGDIGEPLQVNAFNTDRSAFETLANLYAYTSERGLTRARLDRPLTLAEETESRTGLRPVTVARGVYNGRWNPEPLADDILARELARRRGLAISYVDIPLADFAAGGNGAGAAVLWIRGVDDHAFSDADLEGLRSYIEAGGVILFENVGGVTNFGRQAEDAVAKIIPTARFRRATRHRLMTGADLSNGRGTTEVSYRLFSLEKFGSRERRPRVRMLVTPAGESRVFVSREDLTHALLDQPCWGISGYVRDDAIAILGNLFEFAAEPE